MGAKQTCCSDKEGGKGDRRTWNVYQLQRIDESSLYRKQFLGVYNAADANAKPKSYTDLLRRMHGLVCSTERPIRPRVCVHVSGERGIAGGRVGTRVACTPLAPSEEGAPAQAHTHSGRDGDRDYVLYHYHCRPCGAAVVYEDGTTYLWEDQTGYERDPWRATPPWHFPEVFNLRHAAMLLRVQERFPRVLDQHLAAGGCGGGATATTSHSIYNPRITRTGEPRQVHAKAVDHQPKAAMDEDMASVSSTGQIPSRPP